MSLNGDDEGEEDDEDRERHSSSPVEGEGEDGFSHPATTTAGSNLYPCAECDAGFVLIEDLEIHYSQEHSRAKIGSQKDNDEPEKTEQQQYEQKQLQQQMEEYDTDDEEDVEGESASQRVSEREE